MLNHSPTPLRLDCVGGSPTTFTLLCSPCSLRFAPSPVSLQVRALELRLVTFKLFLHVDLVSFYSSNVLSARVAPVIPTFRFVDAGNSVLQLLVRVERAGLPILVS